MHSKFRLAGSVFLLLLVLCATGVRAQSPQERRVRIRAAVETGAWQTALTELQGLSNADAGLFRANEYDYLHGRLSERVSDATGASASYESVVSRNGLLSEYALWHLARIARGTGDLVLERERLRRLVAASAASVLHDAAVLRLAKSFFESTDYSAAATSVRPLTLSKNIQLAREAAVLLGQSDLRSGKESEAREVFTRLLMQMPDASRPDDFALAAVRALDALDNTPAGVIDTPRAQPSEAEYLLRASVYQFNRDFAGARTHYLAVVEHYPQSSTVPNALYQVGRGLYLEGKCTEAINYFQKTLDQFPQSMSARDALSYIASSQARLKRIDDAVAASKSFITRFPDAPNPERPYLNIIDTLHEAGRYPEALDWVRQTRSRFKGAIGSTLALFAQMRIHLAQGSWDQAIADADELLKLSDLGGTRVPGGTSQTEINFLRTDALEQAGRIDEAITGYLSIPDGRNEYYGARATQRLLGIAAKENSRSVQTRLGSLVAAAKAASANGQADQARTSAQASLRLTEDPVLRAEMLKILQATYETLPGYKLTAFKLVPLGRQEMLTIGDSANREHTHKEIADDLFFLGLYDEAMPELFAARATANTGPQNEKQSANQPVTPSVSPAFSDEAYTVAAYSLRGGLPNRAVRFAEPLWKTVPADYVLNLAPGGLAELLYPAPYRESLLKHGPSKNVDPRFVLSIARQESRYQADAKSVAAARGMMQFISSTANEIATQLTLHDFSQDDLYDPDTAILFGSQYLANLFQQFPGQPDAVAAAYNSGADNVTRWIARSRAQEPDRYVAEIGFSQTKDYVYRVMTNFWNYQRLYDAQLQSQSFGAK
jgi:soluble lytic murein transglycosylase-like protein/TolA-binding protein